MYRGNAHRRSPYSQPGSQNYRCHTAVTEEPWHPATAATRMSLPAGLAAITKSDHMLTDPDVAASYVTDWIRPASVKPGRTCSDDNESPGDGFP